MWIRSKFHSLFRFNSALLMPVEHTRYHGIGIRIEDNIFVTDDGYRNITENIPKEIDEVEAAIRGGKE